ncbi:hypothetical protein [Streptomyces sp. NPDC051677]|uniref:hypothetical protein n=1 Tax=Streptomyces sp. NPDC051677 TaxID=3365669 RepID=UPI0037D71BF6
MTKGHANRKFRRTTAHLHPDIMKYMEVLRESATVYDLLDRMSEEQLEKVWRRMKMWGIFPDHQALLEIILRERLTLSQ